MKRTSIICRIDSIVSYYNGNPISIFRKCAFIASLLFLICPLLSLSQATKDTSMTLNEKEKKTILEERGKKVNLGKSGTTEVRCQVINTNFTIPLIRFNTVNKDGADNNQKGNVSLFNSIGAGISYNWGRMTITTDENGKTINTEMDNTVGLQLGLLFAANSSSGNNANVFAPTFSFTALNFQIGCGYELGTVSAKENRFFYTVAYGIPISKLIKGGFYVVKKSTPIDENAGFLF